MKALLIGSLSLLAGLAAAHGFAQDTVWRPANTPPAFERVAPSTGCAVTLSRPVPITSVAPAPVVPVAALERPAPLFRAKTLDPDDFPQLMPVGPVSSSTQNQPGAAKPMAPSAEPLHAPRLVETSTVSESPSVFGRWRRSAGCACTTDSVGPIAGEVVEVHPGGILDDCGTCDSCITETCGPCCGRRWRDWCGCCDDPCCLQRPHLWIRGEYLLWGISNQNLPPMLTVGDTSNRVPGAIGQPGTIVLFGDEQGQDEVRSGGRVALGFWFPRRCNWGMDASVFMLAPRSTTFEKTSSDLGSPFLARPYFNVNTNQEDREIVADPFGTTEVGRIKGTFSYTSTTRLWGVDADLRRRLWCGPRYWLDALIGYRHVDLSDTIDIFENPTQVDSPNNTIVSRDHFATRNSFNGIQLGLEGEARLTKRWFVAGSLKFAMGNMNEVINIDGSQTLLQPGQDPIFARGGLYALASNIGRFDTNRFAFVPEFGIKLGFDVNDHWRLYAGYNLLYMSRVVRAGDQIDRNVNDAMFPDFGVSPPDSKATPPLRPAVLFRQSDFWAQGGQFGIEYHW